MNAHPLGLHAPQLADVRALRTKDGRRARERFALEGATLLAEAVAAGLRPEAVYLTDRAAAAFGVADAARRANAPVFLIPERAMERISSVESPPGILAVMRTALTPLEDLFADGGTVAILAGISDPGNAGTLLRSAEIFGIEAVTFTDDAVEPHNPKVVRAAMGALFRQRVAVAPSAAIVEAAHAAGYEIVATAGDGVALSDFRFSPRTAIAIGNERRGVDASLQACDRRVAIEQIGAGESLNAAIAGSIVFYLLARARTEETTTKRDALSRLPRP